MNLGGLAVCRSSVLGSGRDSANLRHPGARFRTGSRARCRNQPAVGRKAMISRAPVRSGRSDSVSWLRESDGETNGSGLRQHWQESHPHHGT